MTRNVGKMDQRVRIGVGAVAGLLSLGILGSVVPGPAILAPLLGIAAIGLIATGVVGFCGLYALLGVDTCSIEQQSSS